MKIEAYTYEADTHCVECARARFEIVPRGTVLANAKDANGISFAQSDEEGNIVLPVFSTGKIARPMVCGTCRNVIEP